MHSSEVSMSQGQGYLLPHGARGIDFERFSWEVRPDGKVHFFAKDQEGAHWTVHPGGPSGVLDLHQASLGDDGTKSYQTLFMIKLDDLIRVANETGPILIPSLLQQFRPLSLRWVRRRKITIVRDPSSTDGELAAVTHKNRRKRLEFDAARLQDSFDRSTPLEEVLRMPDGWFRLMAIRRWGTRWIGVAVKATDTAGVVHLVWARPADLVFWGEEAEDFLRTAAAKYLISPEDYPKYLRS